MRFSITSAFGASVTVVASFSSVFELRFGVLSCSFTVGSVFGLELLEIGGSVAFTVLF